MSNEENTIFVEDHPIEKLIYNIRGKQVMIDCDLAALYQVSTKRLNEQVNRNKARFPKEFMFQLSEDEYNNLRSQIATSSKKKPQGGRRYLPYAFTEQGIAMLSAVLRSEIAIKVSVDIMNSFVKMRHLLLSNVTILERLDRVELKQLESEQKFERLFNHIESKLEIKQNIFFEGQIYDAFSFIIDLIKKAKNKLILIDNYVDINTLNLLCKKDVNVDILIITASKNSLTKKDINKFNIQYPHLSIATNDDFHDRFLIIDDKVVYQIGASIKDAGKKIFCVMKVEDSDLKESLINKIESLNSK